MAHRLVPVPCSRELCIHPAQHGWAVGGGVGRQAGLEGSIQLCALRLGEDRLTDLTGWRDVQGTAQAQPQVTTVCIARGCRVLTPALTSSVSSARRPCCTGPHMRRQADEVVGRFCVQWTSRQEPQVSQPVNHLCFTKVSSRGH